jgi:hypothetical protein
MVVDLDHHRLFVAALGNGTVEVVDLNKGKVTGRIGNLREPQGLAYLASSNELVCRTVRTDETFSMMTAGGMGDATDGQSGSRRSA